MSHLLTGNETRPPMADPHDRRRPRIPPSLLDVNQPVEDGDVRPGLRQQLGAGQVLALLVGVRVLEEALVLLHAVFLTLLERLECRGVAEQLGRPLDELGPRPPRAGAVRRVATPRL